LPVKHPLYGQKSLDPTCCDKEPYDGFISNKPISFINAYISSPLDGIESNPSFFDRASKNGTVFIYAKTNGYNSNQLIYV